MNHKRLYRVYREAGLCLRRKKRKHCVRMSAPLRQYTAANQEWALDFVHDVIAAGRAIRVLSVVDAFTRECLALEVDTSFASRRVTRVLDEIIARRGRAAGDSLRQRPGTNQPSFPGLVHREQDRAGAYPAGQADAERARGELPRTAARRVPAGQLVSEPVRRQEEDRYLARQTTTSNGHTAAWAIEHRQSSQRAKRAMEKTRAAPAWKTPHGVSHFPTAPAAAG